jgi:hypothetical protein
MTTRRVAGHVRRGQQRRERREQEAYAMQNENRGNEPDDWRQLRQVLDESMHELSEADRLALLVRFFEGRELRRVGEVLGMSENAARMRVQRALEKLRGIRNRKGVATTAAGLAALLAANTVTAAPAALLASAAASALTAGGVVKLGGLAAAKTMILAMKAHLSFASIVILAGAPLVIQQLQIHNARAEFAGLRQDLAPLDLLRASDAQAAANRSAAEELALLQREEAELTKLQLEARNLEAVTGGPRKADWAKAERALRAAQADRDEAVAETEADELRDRTVNSMKQIGLAARIFATDNADKFPHTFEDMKEMLASSSEAAIDSSFTRSRGPSQRLSPSSSCSARKSRAWCPAANGSALTPWPMVPSKMPCPTPPISPHGNSRPEGSRARRHPPKVFPQSQRAANERRLIGRSLTSTHFLS